MKSLIVSAMLTLSLNAMATPLITCNTVLSFPDSEPVPSKFELMADNVARVTQKVDGHTSSYEDTYTASVYVVRKGLTENTDVEGLNPAEALIVHAMILENDPDLEGQFTTGINLKKVDSAWVFTIGEVTNMGGTSIVEARDAKGKKLGSFLGGFLVSPCK
jgi:hypothetical protein